MIAVDKAPGVKLVTDPPFKRIGALVFDPVTNTMVFVPKVPKV